MHYSVLPWHFTLEYTDVMLLLCHVWFGHGFEHLNLCLACQGLGLILELLSLESKPGLKLADMLVPGSDIQVYITQCWEARISYIDIKKTTQSPLSRFHRFHARVGLQQFLNLVSIAVALMNINQLTRSVHYEIFISMLVTHTQYSLNWSPVLSCHMS